jgi:uncharacterized protein (DUF1015 family)
MKDPELFAPFSGERYADPRSLAARLAPPYDVISPARRAELAAQDPCNIVHVDLPEAPRGEDPYREAARLLERWRADGTLVRDAEVTAYVLRTSGTFPDGSSRQRTGVFLAVAAEPFARGRVLPHERTHAGPKEDRRRLTHATGCNLSPVFLLAPDSTGALVETLAETTAREPWASCTALGSQHEVWIASGQAARRIAAAASREPAYVADGHHRFETAVLFRGEAPERWRDGATRTLSHVVSFRDPGLEILPTHRLVVGAPVTVEAFRAAAAPYFSEAPRGGKPVFTAAFAGGAEIPLIVRTDADLSGARDLPTHPAVRGLAVALADAVAVGVVGASLLGQLPELRYTPDAGEARDAARAGRCAFALLLPPTRLDEVRRVADAGQIMPPKSTFFAPKVPTGVVLRPLDAPV